MSALRILVPVKRVIDYAVCMPSECALVRCDGEDWPRKERVTKVHIYNYMIRD